MLRLDPDGAEIDVQSRNLMKASRSGSKEQLNSIFMFMKMIINKITDNFITLYTSGRSFTEDNQHQKMPPKPGTFWY
jgi:hypothetical protein